MSTRILLVSFLGAAASGSLLTGCGGLECAEGTHEQDGECVSNDTDPDSAQCGPMTHLENGVCVVDDPTVCDDATTTPVFNEDTGVTTCVGTAGNCNQPLSCIDDVDPGKNKVCGRMIDVETQAPIQAATPTFLPCDDPGAAQDGPCQLDVQFYDALEFAGNPSTAPLAVEDILIDDCGRFVGTNITHPGTGFMGIGVDDKAGGDDNYRLTGSAFAIGNNEVVSGAAANGYAVRISTDEDWSGDVGFPTTNTFVDRGVYVAWFIHGATPVSGVTITRGGSAVPANDFYMDDASPLSRTSVSTSQTSTGPNGIGILHSTGNGIVLHSGEGSEEAGCEWPSNQAAAIPNVMFFQPRPMVEAGTEDPCP
jgi:hypothetical protein